MSNLNSKVLKGLVFGISMIFASLFFGNISFAQGEMHVCPGTGESCEAVIKFEGKDVKISSFKTKGSGTVVVKPAVK